jgi:hypothetical protein
MLDRIVAFEKVDGRGTFTPKQIDDEGARIFELTDMDIDGDLDLLMAHSGALAWQENIDGKGNLGPRNFVSSGREAEYTFTLSSSDLDGDGDRDVLSGSSSGVKWYESRPIGDVNGDGRFDSADLVLVMQYGEYEDHLGNNSSFEQGDWNGDGEFDSADLVLAFQANTYVAASLPGIISSKAPRSGC